RRLAEARELLRLVGRAEIVVARQSRQPGHRQEDALGVGARIGGALVGPERILGGALGAYYRGPGTADDDAVADRALVHGVADEGVAAEMRRHGRAREPGLSEGAQH